MTRQLLTGPAPASRAVRRLQRCAAMVPFLVATVACFPARTVPRDDLRTAWPIQIQYERPMTAHVTSPVGTARTVTGVTEVRGVLTTLAGDSAVVTAATLKADGRQLELRADEVVHVSIAASAVDRLRQEQFSGKRTLGAAGITIGFVLLALGLAIVLLVRGID
jgi:hypothetical protein